MSNRFTKVCVVGMGYIGLPTAAVFANSGVDVVGVDVNPEAVHSINAGKPHIVEPDLDILLRKVVEQGKLRASLTPDEADAFILAVPTPFKADHQPDLSFVEAAARSIAPYLRSGTLVVLESTSPVGTTEQLSQWLAAARPDLTFPHDTDALSDVYVAHCPERVLPGHILREVVENDRVVGGLTQRCTQEALSLYRVFVTGTMHPTTARTAELAKLAENSYRDVNIAFANELNVICDGLGINVWDLIRLANLHPRVNILRPGPGVGGHCIAVDPWFIVAADPDNSRLIRTARIVNDDKPRHVVDKVIEAARGREAPTIACLGLSYKADVDDLRESPALEVAKMICEAEIGRVVVVEPHIRALPRDLASTGAELVSFERAVVCADIIVVLVDHLAFGRGPNELRADQTIIDTRGVW